MPTESHIDWYAIDVMFVFVVFVRMDKQDTSTHEHMPETIALRILSRIFLV
jgi:hypothetical protein